MKKIIEYENADGHCDVGDVVFLGPNFTEKAELLTIRKSEDGVIYVFKSLVSESIYGTDNHGVTPFFGKPYVYAKELKIKEDKK